MPLSDANAKIMMTPYSEYATPKDMPAMAKDSLDSPVQRIGTMSPFSPPFSEVSSFPDESGPSRHCNGSLGGVALSGAVANQSHATGPGAFIENADDMPPDVPSMSPCGSSRLPCLTTMRNRKDAGCQEAPLGLRAMTLVHGLETQKSPTKSHVDSPSPS